MPKYHKDDVERFFDYGIFVPKRTLYMGSLNVVGDDQESGTDHDMAANFVKGIVALESMCNKPIVVYMNNLGGSWDHGMMIYDAIRASRCHVIMVAMGCAYSMGSIILQAADTRIISKYCNMMIHDGTENLVGDCRSVEAWGKHTTKIRHAMYDLYWERMVEKKPRITIGQIQNMCAHDTIFTAEETVAYGLADWVLGDNSEIEQYTASGTEKKWQPTKTRKRK